ncbi:Manganese ABC transporter substrate-binding lipoprotein [Leucobacter soli]|uniref:Manganese ABC transporter substrate-binding lipoprotein n=2 Tax=Leucobacter soli TaxID=2812850 RepID=A0A916JYA0_9MICO|nr:metal ABC transporter substrate-binding protein [Leucobacter soli]CAG7605900.1 Manganese ABC transporter substrate-binding lipoprotein [Leucobacter soli]
MNTRTPLTLLAAGAVAGALALTGCAGDPAGAGAGAEGTLKVVATTTQLADFAAQVGGSGIALTGLLAPGASAHHFDPSPADLLALGAADVLIVNGAGLETFIDSAVEASGFSGTVVTASDGIDLAEAERITAEAEEEAEHDHDHADEDHADHDHADEGEEHADEHAEEVHEHDEDHAHEGDEHDHDHGGLNPHIWTSPRLAQGMVAEIAEGLSAADPAHAAGYEERADAYTARLAALDTWIGEQFSRVPDADRVLVSGHDSLRYYLHDYGIAFIGSLVPSFEDNAEPSAAQIDELVEEIREHGVKAIFVESSMSPKLARTVAAEAGIRVVDAESLYADSLGPADTAASTYLGATIENTRTILEAWGAGVDPLPAELESQ